MIRRIVSGYIGILRTLFRIVILLAICVGAGALIVWPLWKLADANPSLYTLLFGIIVGALAVFLVAFACVRSFRKNRRKFLFRLASFLVLAAGIAGAVMFVLAWKRLFAAVTILITLAAYGILAFGLAPERHFPKS